MTDYAGNFMQLYSPSSTFHGDQYKYMEELLAQYPNVIDFSGHSHYRWYLQNYDSKADIGQVGKGATMIHLPSCGFPRDATYNGYLEEITSSKSTNWTAKIRGELSEIGYVDVYDDHIVLHGLELTGSPTGDFSHTDKDYAEVAGACFNIRIKQ